MNAGGPILVATRNAGKLREVRAVLGEFGVGFCTLDQFAGLPDAVESADTFEENAAAKAVHFSVLTGTWTLADDSGLEVDALGGEPGVRSARYAGRHGDDAANNAKLIAALTDTPPEGRTARFRCALALADGRRILARAGGTFEGRVVDQPRGTNGFGYDPHFFVPDLGRTAAELPPEEKNRLSHRGQALRALVPQLAAILHSTPGAAGESAAG